VAPFDAIDILLEPAVELDSSVKWLTAGRRMLFTRDTSKVLDCSIGTAASAVIWVQYHVTACTFKVLVYSVNYYYILSSLGATQAARLMGFVCSSELGVIVDNKAISNFEVTQALLVQQGVYIPSDWISIGSVPAQPLNATSFALSLLLVFRTNTSYARWDNARKVWGGMLNRTRDITRQVCHSSFSPLLWLVGQDIHNTKLPTPQQGTSTSLCFDDVGLHIQASTTTQNLQPHSKELQHVLF
jgi:hypothetical protein